MKKADNIVFNHLNNEYDAYKKEYPTSFNSKKFNLEEIKDLKHIARPYFDSKMKEIKNNYVKLIEELGWNQRIYNAEYSFNPIIGEKYYLYNKDNNKEFLSIINPSEWRKSCLGTFTLDSNQIWKKIK